MAAKDVVRQDIGDDRRRLSGHQMLELAFLEVGVDPKVMRGDDGDEIGAAGDIGADLGGAISDIAVDRRADFGVAEIELSRVNIGLGLRDVGLGDGDLGVQNRELLPRGVEAGLGRNHAGLSREVERRRALRVLPRSGGGLRKVAIALIVLLGERRLRILGVEVGLRLANGRLLQRLFALEAVEGRLARLDNRGRAVGGGAEVAVVKTDQRLSRAHIFVVANEDLSDEAGHVRRYRGDIAPGIGVVGAFDEAPDGPIFMAIARADERDDAAKRRVHEPFEPRSCQQAGRGAWVCSPAMALIAISFVRSFCRRAKKSVYTPIWPDELKLDQIWPIIGGYVD